MTDAVEQKEQELITLEVAVEDAKATLDGILASINGARLELEDWERVSAEAEKNAEIAKKSLARIESDLNDARGKLTSKNSEVLNVQKEVGDAQEKLASLNKEIVLVQDSIQKEREAWIVSSANEISAHRDTMKKLAGEKRALEVDIEGLDERLTKKKNDYADLNAKEVALIDRIKTLTLHADAMKEAEEVLQKQINERTTESNFLKETNDSLREEGKRLQAENDAVSAQLPPILKQKKALEEDIQGLETKKEEMTASIFAISEREEKLAQREDFIKAQYKRAGIAWREIT